MTKSNLFKTIALSLPLAGAIAGCTTKPELSTRLELVPVPTATQGMPIANVPNSYRGPYIQFNGSYYAPKNGIATEEFRMMSLRGVDSVEKLSLKDDEYVLRSGTRVGCEF